MLFTKKADLPHEDAPVWAGAEALRSMLTPLGELVLDDANVRKHPERNLEAVRASLERFGQRKPIVVRAGVVVAGNGTLESARKLGWSHLAVVDASDLTPSQARAYAIADNKTGELAEWDYQGLAEQFREMSPELLAATGFAPFEIEPLLQAEWKVPEGAEGDNAASTMISFRATEEQAEVIRRAIERIKADYGEGSNVSDGRALELVCADFLSGA